MTRKLTMGALVVACVLCSFYVYARFLRTRAYPNAALIADTPNGTAMGPLVTVVEPVAPGVHLSWNNEFQLEDDEHEIAVSWSYLGGAFGRDLYRIETTLDGVKQNTLVSVTDKSVVVFSQDGYELWIDPDRADL